MKNIRKHVRMSRVNSVWYCMSNRKDNKKITLEKKPRKKENET